MAFSPTVMGYDRALTIFSPDGKLYQVEYAFQAVRQGWSTLGIRVKDGVVLAAEKALIKPLLDLSGLEKVVPIDTHVGATFAGFGSDGRILIDQARLIAVRHRLTYGEPIPIELLTKSICDIKQMYTQHGGVRPFGVSLIIAGVDSTGPKLLKTDPAGQYFGYYATAIGRGETKIEEVLEKEYKYDMSLDEAVKLAVKALASTSEEKLGPRNIDVAIIPVDTKTYRKLSEDEVSSILSSLGLSK
ncbi:MAG: archaeal proteasome endopeptidase complex subunit alpha [Desulfurococcales archaeon]|jgi:proteasome alpha subunit|uniref:Proteasome subunit alpha n=1 Tax=Fervidicoccus fontis TaxID=683846 RepID=A0A7C1IDF6_9CREN|nr:archaeal proteasome endopeptidase complex subunit alpha [Desulfurococcales archaeon]